MAYMHRPMSAPTACGVSTPRPSLQYLPNRLLLSEAPVPERGCLLMLAGPLESDPYLRCSSLQAQHPA